MGAPDDLLLEDAGGVRWVTINRPDAGNSLTADARRALIATFEEASTLVAVRAVVLTAAGERHFCTGADLRAGDPPAPKPDDAPERPVGTVARLIATGAQRLMASILDCEKPVIAAVNGTAAGIGSHLALSCDLVVAADHARFIEIFVRRGLIPDGAGAYLLPRLVGPQKAKELLFFGDDVPAADAMAMGLVNRVVPGAELHDTVAALADRLAASPTIALSLTKRLVNRSLDVDRATAFAEEAWAQEANMQTADGQEGVEAFKERRDPNYRGW